ncbi:MAG: hypothetical protein FWG35_03945 [Spirochaetaceae bacterium]|nr:hypothetical protein [Spirochaetaceae bacterium]
MTSYQQEECRKIIHGYALLAGAGNLVPVPAVDILVDVTTLTAMTRRLGAVFEQNITREFAKNFVILLVKRQLAVRITKAVVKIIPVLGWAVGPVLGFFMMQAAGWELAARLDKRQYS